MAKQRKEKSGDEKIGLIVFGFIIVMVLVSAVVIQMLGFTKQDDSPAPTQVETPPVEVKPNEDELILDELGTETETEVNQPVVEEVKEPTVIEEKDEFENTYYVPKLTINGNKFTLEDETYTAVKEASADSFLTQAYEKAKQYKNVTVTELVTFKNGSNKSITQTLREIVLDYNSLTSKHVVSKKVNKSSPVLLEEYYTSSDGAYSSYLDEESKEKVYAFNSYGETVTRDNLLTFTNIELKNRSPFHLAEDFHRIETRPQGIKIGENQDYYVFYKENEEDIFGTKHYEIEVYLFDKMTFEPIRYVLYEKQVGEEKTDYSMKEVIYSDYNSSLKIKVPQAIQTKALGIEE